MSVLWIEGFETAAYSTDLVSRGTLSPSLNTSGATVAVASTNQVPANARYAGGTSLCTSAVTTTAVPVIYTFPGGSLRQGNGSLNFSVTAYTDSTAAVPASVGYPRVTQANGVYYVSAGGSATAGLSCFTLQNMGSTTIPTLTYGQTIGSVATSVTYDVKYFGSYYYVLHSTNTVLTLDTYSVLTGTSVGTSTVALTSFAASVSGFTLVHDSTHGTYFITGTDANTYIRVLPVTIDGTTGVATMGAVTSLAAGGAAGITITDPVLWAHNSQWYIPGKSAAQIAQTSSDGGVSWTQVAGSTNVGTFSVAQLPTLLIFGGYTTSATASVYTMDTSNTVTAVMLPEGTVAQSIMLVVGNGSRVIAVRRAITTTNTCFVTMDGASWTAVTLPTTGSVASVSHSGDYFFITMANGIVLFSADGLSWRSTAALATGATGVPLAMLTGCDLTTSQPLFGFQSPSSVVYSSNPSGTVTQSAIAVTPPGDGWHTYETNLSSISDTSYTATYMIDSIPVASQSLTYAGFPNQVRTAVLPATMPNGQCAAYSSTLDSYVAISATNIYYMGPGYGYWSQVGPTLTGGTCVRYLNGQFFVFTTSGFFSSPDGMNWSSNVGSPAGITIVDAAYGNGKYMAVGTATTALYTSMDGNIWSTSTPFAAQAAGYSVIGYVAGQWIAIPSSTNVTSGATIPATAYYSTDNGSTWLTFTTQIAASIGPGFAANGLTFVYSSAGRQVTTLTLTTNGASAPVATQTVNPATKVFCGLCYTGQYFAGISQEINSAYGFIYSTDGITWTLVNITTGATALDVACVPAKGGCQIIGNGNNPSLFMYHALADVKFAFQSSLGGVYAIDDILVNDGQSPNAGPQGEVRIQLIPSTTDVQSQWDPTPAGSNAAAATVLPISKSASSFVGAASVGQKDIYGTTGYTVPVGYRPLAVQTEAYAQRVFSSSTSVSLGLISDGVEVDINANIVTTPGANQFITKIYNEDPATESPWLGSALASTEISVSKTA